MLALIRFSVGRPVSVLLASATVLVLGLLSLQKMAVDYLPDLKVPQLTVISNFPGLPSREVRELMTIPLEDAFSGASGLKSMTSQSRDGTTVLRLEYQWGTDMVLAGVQARELIDAAYLRLPHGAEKPIVLPVNPGDKAVLLLGVFPEKGTTVEEAKRLAERELKTLIQQVDGVGSLLVEGGRHQEIQVLVDQKSLAAKGLTPQSVAEFLQNENQEFPAGSLQEGSRELIVQADNRADTLQELEAQVIPLGGQGATIRLGEVARVQWGREDQSAAFYSGGAEGLGIEIQRRSGFSPVRLSENLRAAWPGLTATFQGKLKLEILEDRSEPIREAVDGLFRAILLGTAFTFFVLLAFLRRWSSSLIVLFLIPFSIITSFLFLGLLGVNLNIMSLGGVDIGIGMLVDTGVVVLGNLMVKARRTDLESIASATFEMARPLAGATLTSFIVFLPLIFLPGLLGRLFSDLAWAVVVPLSVSYVASVTLLPALYRYLGNADLQPVRSTAVELAYRRSLRAVLRHPLRFAALLAVFVAAGAASFPFLSTGWLQTVRGSHVEAVVGVPAGASMEYLAKAVQDGSARLARNSAVLGVVAVAGRSADDLSSLTDPGRRAEDLRYSIRLDPALNWTLADALKELGPAITPPGAQVRFDYPGLVLAQIFPFREDTRRWVLRFDDPSSRQSFLDAWAAEEKAGTSVLGPRETKESLLITPRRELFAKGGLSLQQMAQTVAVSLQGQYVGVLERDGVQFDIRVWVPGQDRSDAKALERVILPSGESGTTVLSSVAALTLDRAPPLLLRENRKDSLYLDFPPDQTPQLPPIRGLEVVDPEQKAFTDMAWSLGAVFLLAFLLLYLVLGAQFESAVLPLLLMAAIPLGILGVGLTLVATGQSLNLNSVLGMLVILGALANHAIILYDILHHKRDGSVLRGVYEGAGARFRPILVTLLTTVFALLPTALDFQQTNPQSGLATAIIGGLSVSTVLAFYLMPLLFIPFLRRRWRRK